MVFSFRCAIPDNGPSLFEIELPKIERHMHLQDNRLGVPRYNFYSPKIFRDSLLDSLLDRSGYPFYRQYHLAAAYDPELIDNFEVRDLLT